MHCKTRRSRVRGRALSPRADGTLDREVERLQRRLEELENAGDEAQMLRAIVEASPEFIVRIDRDYTIQYINRVGEQFEKDEVVGQSFLHFIDEAHRQIAADVVDSVLATGTAGEYRVVAAASGGGQVTYTTKVAPIFDDYGEVVAALLVARDIGKELELIETLQARETQLRVAIEATGFGLWSYELESDKIAWHREVAEFFGLSPDQAPRSLQEFWPLIVPEDQKRVDALVLEVIESGEAGELEFRTRLPDGSIRWLFARVAVERDKDGTPLRLYGGLIDITEPKELAEQLRHAQKMDALGQLATGIAHNFNNLLTAIAANVSMLRKRTPESSLPFVESVAVATNRGANLVRQLMLFARAESGVLEEGVDVEGLLSETISMCSATFGDNIEIEARIAEQLPRVKGDATQLLQVFLNICLNSRDAMAERDGARLEIAAAVEPGDHIAPRVADPTDGAPADRFVCVRITDNGCGMDRATASRVFEPFFTTKDLGRGTGLGLSTSYAIIRRHGGDLRCDSQPGVGSTFFVYLPA